MFGTRRALLAHCSLIAAAAFSGQGLPARADAANVKPAPVILVVGDSLSAEYGLARGSG